MKRFTALTALTACLAASSAFGSTVTFSVLNETSYGQPGAKVTLSGPKNYTTTTDQYGAASLQSVAAGTYTVTFQAAGYSDYTGSLTIDDVSANYDFTDYIKPPANPTDFSSKILSQTTIPIGHLGKYEKHFDPGKWPVLAKICARNSASEFGSDVELGDQLFAPFELITTSLTCDTTATSKVLGMFAKRPQLAPKFRVDYVAISGNTTATYVNGSVKPALDVRATPQTTKTTSGTPNASVYSFNVVLGTPQTVYFKGETSGFYFGFNPTQCLGADGKPETDPAKLKAHICESYDSDAGVSAFPEDVVTKTTDSTGTEYTYVKYQVQEAWLIAQLDDGSQPGQPAKDGTQIVQKLELWLSGTSGVPIIQKDHFSMVVPTDSMAEAVAVQQILAKDPTAQQNFATALIKAYAQADAASAGQDSASQAPYASGSYVRLGTKTNAAVTGLGVDQSESSFVPDSDGNLVAAVNDGDTWQSALGLDLGFFMGTPTNNVISWHNSMLPTPAGYPRITEIGTYSTKVRTTIRLGNGGPTGTFPAALAELKANASDLAPYSMSADQVAAIQKTAEKAFEDAFQQNQ